MRQLISNIFPSSLKEKIKQSDFFTHRIAKQLATSSKRIDICAAQFAHLFHLSKHPSIEDKICLEIGAGWVLTHAIVCYLLGAEKVIATDIVPCARPETITAALKNCIASIPRDILAPFSDHSRIRERYKRLNSISQFEFNTLKELGIEYKSPIDFAVETVDMQVDFIYSFSVLEHVPYHDVPALLNNLVKHLNIGGTMIHCIHLEDHKDFDKYPFDFLGIPMNQFIRNLQTARGNRIRGSEWEKIFDDIKGTRTDIIYKYYRSDRPLPKTIDPSISFTDEKDIRTSHIGVYTRK